MAAHNRTITVFGGTGFLGRRVVRRLRERAFAVRIASRHPDRDRSSDPQLQPVKADIHDEQSVADALSGAYAAVNAVSLYVERGGETFHSVHVEGAGRIAAQAQRGGVERLVHVSGIGSDAASPSLYIRKRGEGEQAVRSAFPVAIVVRPAVMFGPDDGFLTTILDLLRRLPIFPMFGRGSTRLQPADVEDVAEAITRTLSGHTKQPATFECGGPRVYSYRTLLEDIAREAGLKPILVPLPFSAWHGLARIAELLPGAPITRNQVELMQVDTVTSTELPGFRDLDIAPRALEDTLRDLLGDQNVRRL